MPRIVYYSDFTLFLKRTQTNFDFRFSIFDFHGIAHQFFASKIARQSSWNIPCTNRVDALFFFYPFSFASLQIGNMISSQTFY